MTIARLIPLLVTLAMLAAGCATSRGPDPRGIGGMIGAAAGRASTSAVFGAEAGTDVGYVIGDEADRAKAARLDVSEHYEVGRLGATRWNVLDVRPADRVPAFVEKIVYFRLDGRVETTTKLADGRTRSIDESYRVVGGTLILSGPGYLVNASYRIVGQQMILNGDGYRVTLVRLPS